MSRGDLKQPLRRSLPRPRGSYDCQKYNERHDALRDDAVETPCLKDTRLNVREVKSKDKPHERRYDEQAIAAHERENRNGCVTGNADSGYWNSVNYGVTAVVDHAAIPVSVNVAGRRVGRVVDAQRKSGNCDSGNGEQRDQITHRLDLSLMVLTAR